MNDVSKLACAAILSGLCAVAHSASPQTSDGNDASALQARIARVERGLATPSTVKGGPDHGMTLAQRMAFHRVPAVSIALIENGRVEWTRACGLADVASRRPATPDTLFQAASISKAASAIGALRLVEQGNLSLDGDANEHLAAWTIPPRGSAADPAVSLRMLLNHSAGTTVHGYGGYPQGQALPTLVQMLDGLPPANSAAVRIDAAPGSTWRYSGGGYTIVQLMVTEASGQPFDRYMKAAVLDPLGMSRSTFAAPLPERLRDRAATAYDAEARTVAGGSYVHPESAAAGLWSTAGDLARLVIGVQRAEAGEAGALVSRATASTLLTRGLGEYGLGFFVEDLGDRVSFSHSGGNRGFRARIYGYTRTGQGIAVMTNGDNGAALIDEILVSVAEEYDWPEFRLAGKAAVSGGATGERSRAGG